MLNKCVTTKATLLVPDMEVFPAKKTNDLIGFCTNG
jgi:hypothetical protein